MDQEEVVIWTGRGLLYADKPKCRKAAPSKMRYFFNKSRKIMLRKKFHCKSKICARVKIPFSGLISMFSFIIQSLMKTYF